MHGDVSVPVSVRTENEYVYECGNEYEYENGGTGNENGNGNGDNYVIPAHAGIHYHPSNLRRTTCPVPVRTRTRGRRLAAGVRMCAWLVSDTLWLGPWIPACAGMTPCGRHFLFLETAQQAPPSL